MDEEELIHPVGEQIVGDVLVVRDEDQASQHLAQYLEGLQGILHQLHHATHAIGLDHGLPDPLRACTPTIFQLCCLLTHSHVGGWGWRGVRGRGRFVDSNACTGFSRNHRGIGGFTNLNMSRVAQ